jgi:hypothetical protein
MNLPDCAFILAGVIGGGVAIVHGVLVQRLMVTPFALVADRSLGATVRRLVPLLLQYSTFSWFIGGIALIVAAFFFQRQARLAVGLLVGSSYLFGALGNLWVTRGAHPGWMLYTVALCLIGYGVYASDQV